MLEEKVRLLRILVPFKIRSKKPEDRIKIKKPNDEKLEKITVKTPDKQPKKFKLPPERQKTKTDILKKEVRPPSRSGLKDKTTRKDNHMNKPIIEKKPEKRYKKISEKPTRRGILEKKEYRKKNKPILKHKTKTPKREKKRSPTTMGAQKRKAEKISNKTPTTKTVNDSKRRSRDKLPPTYSLSMKTEDENKIVNKSPPKLIVQKTPKKEKTIPPTVIKEKIPKIKVKKPKKN